ncbi:MAG: Alkaline serine protease [Myxococcaceae bacterium]|nr:Alkaline serine protease [Myxococcaceae bacterium]
MRARFAMAIVLLDCALACNPPAERVGAEHVGEASSAIVGGEDDGADPAVVAIVSESLNITLCSGALIGPRTVLTAGHCNFTNVSVRFGADAQIPDRSVAVTTTLVHPSYSAQGAPFDFALLELDTPVTDIAPLTLRTTPLGQSDVGTTIIRHVGFGVSNEATKSGAGHKRTVSYPMTRITDVLVYSGAPGKQTCDNDSGAPGLVRDPDGIERIAGVVSDGPSCHEDGWDGRADLGALRSFVADTRASWDSAVSNADSGTSGDGSKSSGGGCVASKSRGAGNGAWMLLLAIGGACVVRRRARGRDGVRAGRPGSPPRAQRRWRSPAGARDVRFRPRHRCCRRSSLRTRAS